MMSGVRYTRHSSVMPKPSLLIAAIRGAVNGLMAEVLEGHIREHLGSDAISLDQRSEDVEQVVAVLRSYLK